MRLIAGFAIANAMLWIVSASSYGQMREWSDSSGKFRIDAELIRVDDKEVQLRKEDGKIVKIPLNRLSATDQAFIRQRAQSRDGAPPLEAVVRIIVTLTDANGSPQELQIVGCAVASKEFSTPVVITSRMLSGLGMESGFADVGLAKANILDLRTPQQLGVASRLGFPGPQGGPIEGFHEFVIVLPIAEGTELPTLPLADADVRPGDAVFVPLLPKPQSTSKNRPPIKWTKWSVVSSDDSRLCIKPEDGQFPSAGAVPIVNEKHQLVGLYVSQVIMDDERRSVGNGPSLSVIRSALMKAKPATTTVDATAKATPIDTPKFTPIASGPIDESAAWRKSCESLANAVKPQKLSSGEWHIDWGDATDFGAWYERHRFANKLQGDLYRPNKDKRQIVETIKQLVPDVNRAAERLKGIEWTAVVSEINYGTLVRFDLPALPEPLKIGFQVEKADAANWGDVRPGDRVRFACRFELMTIADYPGINVQMTLIDINKP